jgi:tetratricopeptide (TPR) repeat protein
MPLRRDIRETMTQTLRTLDRALEPTLPALLALLDVPVEDPQWQTLDPPHRRQRTLDAVKGLLLRESQVQPLLLVVEDLHWIDSETQALLDSLVESLPTAPLLLLVNYRPEYRHSWGSKTYYSELRLDPLPPEGAEALLDALLGRDTALEPLKRLLAARTGRNPLFIEESVRTLVESQTLLGKRGVYRLARPVDTIRVPATVYAILAARIDRLPPAEKRLLETAAVIGKDVPFSLLQAIAEESEETLQRRLGHLQTAEFLYETRLFPDREHTFKHALTHEVAYGTVLQDRRRALHARIAEAIEQRYAGCLDDHVERLAHHTLQGEVWEPAVRYLWQAGTKAAERSALREAVTAYDHALRALRHLPEDRPTLEYACDIRLRLADLEIQRSDYARALEYVRDMERLAEQLDDDLRRARAHAYMTNICNYLGALDDAVAAGRRALAIAQALGDLRLRFWTTQKLEQTYFFRGEFQHVIDLVKANLTLLPAATEYERSAPRTGLVTTTGLDTDGPSVGDLGFLVLSLVPFGRFAEATEPADAAIQLAERTHQPYAIGWAYYAVESLHLWKGEWAIARVLCERAIEVLREAHQTKFLPNVMASSSWALACLGESGDALQRALEAERLIELDGARGGRPRWLLRRSLPFVSICQTYLLLGRLEDAQRMTEHVMEATPRTAASDAHVLHLQGEIAAHPHRWHPEAAEDCYRRALAVAAGCGLRPLVAHCHLGLGRLYRRTGQRLQAQEHMITATMMYREMDMRFWLEKAEAETKGLV